MFRNARRGTVFAIAVLLFASAALPVWSQAAAVEANREGERAFDRLEIFEAFQKFETALELNPAYPAPMVGLARLLFYLGEYDEALDYVDAARPLLGFD
ncbi:MAG: tetratricopeptide repeat protein, partial [Spirochaetota bacterium]